ncbi:hypothetical protein ACIA5E_11730 [Nocardia asteroides]|uniref:hypothetical protein n=1 Tax=Nocardia asteroides TaxID=1824 RepID=UPI00379A9D47
MGLSIVIQNMNHEEQQRYFDDADATLYRLCAAQPESSVVRGIYRYGDTMFNRYQLTLMLKQIDDIEVRSEAEREAVELLRKLASIALRANGYLMFIGD